MSLPQEAIDALERVKAAQDQARQMFGPDYRSDLNLVFSQPNGDYIRPDTVTKAVRGSPRRPGSRASVFTPCAIRMDLSS